jgi:hypothetical protein
MEKRCKGPLLGNKIDFAFFSFLFTAVSFFILLFEFQYNRLEKIKVVIPKFSIAMIGSFWLLVILLK